MSVQATAWVFERSTHGGSKLLVLLSIANNADTEGKVRYLKQEILASECRMTDRAIRYIVKALVASKELIVRRFVNGDSTSGQAKHEYEIPGVIRDGFHLRGRRSQYPEQQEKFSGSSPASNRKNHVEQPERAVSGDKEPKYPKTLNTTPPTPPASAGGQQKVLEPQPKPANRFLFECNGGYTVEVFAPLGRRLWRNPQEFARFQERTGDQVHGSNADSVMYFFKLKGFRVGLVKKTLDTPVADNILREPSESANE